MFTYITTTTTKIKLPSFPEAETFCSILANIMAIIKIPELRTSQHSKGTQKRSPNACNPLFVCGKMKK